MGALTPCPGLPPRDSSALIFTLADDFDAETAARAGTAAYAGIVLAAGVTAWAVALDDADAQAARLARVSITVEDRSGADDAQVLAALRASAGGSTGKPR